MVLKEGREVIIDYFKRDASHEAPYKEPLIFFDSFYESFFTGDPPILRTVGRTMVRKYLMDVDAHWEVSSHMSEKVALIGKGLLHPKAYHWTLMSLDAGLAVLNKGGGASASILHAYNTMCVDIKYPMPQAVVPLAPAQALASEPAPALAPTPAPTTAGARARHLLIPTEDARGDAVDI